MYTFTFIPLTLNFATAITLLAILLLLYYLSSEEREEGFRRLITDTQYWICVEVNYEGQLYTSTICISYRTSEGEVGAVGEPSSRIAMLTKVLWEKEREVEEIQHELLEQSITSSKVS